MSQLKSKGRKRPMSQLRDAQAGGIPSYSLEVWPFISFFFFFNKFIYLFLAMLGFRFCARAFSSCGKQGPLFIAVRGPLTVAASLVAASLVAASLVAEHRLQTRRLSNCGSRAQPLRSMWDLPRPGLEPVSPALAGRFSTTAPPGKPQYYFLTQYWKLGFGLLLGTIISIYGN